MKLEKILYDKGLDDSTKDEANDLIADYIETLTDVDLLELMKSASEKEEEALDPEEEENYVDLTIEHLCTKLKTAKELQEKEEAGYLYMDRFSHGKSFIDAAVRAYKAHLIVTRKQRQHLLIAIFLKPNKEALLKDISLTTTEVAASPEMHYIFFPVLLLPSLLSSTSS